MLNVFIEITGWERKYASFEVLKSIWESQPFDLLGGDSDNGGEFLNDHLYHWLKKHGIYQTRSRSYFKNYQAYVEQKNQTHVRQFLGYDRAEYPEIPEQLQGQANQQPKAKLPWSPNYAATLLVVQKAFGVLDL